MKNHQKDSKKAKHTPCICVVLPNEVNIQILRTGVLNVDMTIQKSGLW